MEKRKNPLSIQVIYWFTQISFWLFVTVFFASIAFAVALQFEVLGDSLQLHMNMPAETSYTEKGSVTYFGQSQEIEFVEATGKLHFINTNPEVAKWFSGFLLGVVIITLYIFIMFKRFIGNVYRGYIFEHFNIQMLQKMAYGIMALWFYMVLYSRLFYYFIAKNVEFEHLEVSGEINYYSYFLLLALFLWVLSHVFMTGVRLQEEQKLIV